MNKRKNKPKPSKKARLKFKLILSIDAGFAKAMMKIIKFYIERWFN